jgi:hypothetical protein
MNENFLGGRPEFIDEGQRAGTGTGDQCFETFPLSRDCGSDMTVV